MGVLVQPVGGITAVGKAVVGSSTLTSEMEKADVEGLEVRGERKSEMACLSGAPMKKKGRWVPLILLEPSCASRFACLSFFSSNKFQMHSCMQLLSNFLLSSKKKRRKEKKWTK